jgi:hypothetical protein
MISRAIPQQQAVELLYDEHTGTYPILSFSEDDGCVLMVLLHAEMAEHIRRLLDGARAKQQWEDTDSGQQP